MDDLSKRTERRTEKVNAIIKVIDKLPLDLAKEVLQDVNRTLDEKSWLDFSRKSYFDE